MQWSFEQYNPNSKKRDPYGDKFFRDQGSLDSLIRESIQNSLDIPRDSSQPVRMLFGIQYVDSSFCDSLEFQGLNEHLKASEIKPMPLSGSIPFIVFEDFNTRGLEGVNKDDFFYKENINSKSSGGGSHGIGKVVFNTISPIKTIYAYSEFKGGQGIERVFEGMSTLKSHELAGSEYRPDGSISIDCENNAFIQQAFTRQRGMTGLSVAIPYLAKGKDWLFEDSLQQFQKSILDHFYLPILQGKLVVELDFGSDVTIDAQTIDNLAHDKEKHVNLYRQCEERGQISLAVSQNAWQSQAKSDLKDIVPSIEAVVSPSHRSAVLNFDIKVEVSKRGHSSYNALRVLVQKDHKSDAGDRGRVDFWRDDLLIHKAKPLLLPKGFTVLVIIQGNNLSGLLRLTEDPGHTNWQTQGNNAQDWKDYGTAVEIRKLVKYIKDLPFNLVELIDNKSSSLDKNYLGKYFPKPALSDTGQAVDPGGNLLKGGAPEIEPLHFPDFNYSALSDGFSLTLKNKREHPKMVIITMAYGTSTGNAFKQYQKEDFTLGEDILLLTESCNQLAYDSGRPNSIKYEILDGNFKAAFRRFDNERELKIDVESLK